MGRQTRKPDQWIIVDEPTAFKPDLTFRVRKGINQAFENGADVVLIMEDDDWYDPMYIEFMVKSWKLNGQPPIFGIGYTLYVHVFAKKYWFSPHKGRASLMSTLVTRKGMERFEYPNDNYVWLDIDLWKGIRGGRTIEPPKYYSVGIKHGKGQCGGVGHNKNFSHYRNDPNLNELKKHIKSDIEWYQQLKA
jgi:hypothetical protein